MKKGFLLQLVPLAFTLTSSAALTPAELISSLTPKDAGVQIVDRGQDFAVLRTTSTTIDAAGQSTSTTTDVTLLENGLHYFTDGAWHLSQDVVEPFPGGAIATHGPYRTIFSPELKTDAVFDIQTAEGQRVRGGYGRSSSLTAALARASFWEP